MLNIFKKIVANNWKLVLIVVLAFLLISTGLNKPFWGHHDWNGAYWGNVARNYAKYGPFSTGFGMITNVGNVDASEFVYTFHFSPLYPLTLSIAYWFFGAKEEIARSLSIIFSLITVVFMYRIIREKISDFAAFSGILLWVVNPMFLYFGKMPVHDIYILMFVVIGSYYYFQNKLKQALLFVFLAQLSGWPGYSLVPAIILDQLIKNRLSLSKKFFFTISPFIASSFFVFSSLLIHNFLITGSLFGGGLQEIFFTRMRSVDLLSYSKILLSWMNAYYSPVILFSSLGGIIISIKEKKKINYILFFLIFALVYPSLFKDSSYRHDYLLIYFLPFLSISSGFLFDQIKINLKLKYLFVIILALILFQNKKNFLTALNNSDIYKTSVLLGKEINKKAKNHDKVLVVVKDKTIGFDGWHLNYYADHPTTLSTVDVISKEYSLRVVYNSPDNLEFIRLK